MWVRIIGAAAVLGLGLNLPSGAAMADTAVPSFDGPISSGTVITEYLCAAKHVQDLHTAADDARHQFDDSDARIKALDDQIASSRTTINPDNAEQVDAFRRLLKAKDQEEAKLFSVVMPQSKVAIQRYNEAAATYARDWTGKQFDPDALARFQATVPCSGTTTTTTTTSVTIQPLRP